MTAADQQAARATGLDLRLSTTSNGCTSSIAAFYCDYVLRHLLADPSLGETEAERRALVYEGGLTIRTPLRLGHQAAADDAVAEAVDPTDDAIGGLAMVEPGTGDVLAVAQSRPMGDDVDDGETYLNYTIPQRLGDSAGFQAGSTFKASVLAAAIEQGVPLSWGIDSPARISVPQSTFTDCGGERYSASAPWEPGNLSESDSGFMTLVTGTRLSVNTFYAQLTQRTGLCAPYELARSMGVELDNPTGVEEASGLAERVPSFSLGVANVSPVEMAEAYATFAARGTHCSARPVTAIADAAGNVLKEYAPRCERVMQPETADAVNEVLSGVIDGGFASAQDLGIDAAGKTGTTQSARSVWFVGYTPDLATSAMVAGANELGSPVPLDGVRVGGATVTGASASRYAAPMWGDAMRGVRGTLSGTAFVPSDPASLRAAVGPTRLQGSVPLDAPGGPPDPRVRR
ncbi:transglycosylase domain-containing protein [Nocardioides sp. CPCC 205120]|uniref:transglycosylase domain-containing protein n=1 Tax=Nocardioides sp. CPCC 205120 TaxID=3406462 RepID=UPI003B515273